MQSSNLIKIILISCFTLLSIGCSNGDKDSGGNDTWSPRETQELLNEIKNYKVMDPKKYEDPQVMTSRDQYIANMFPAGDAISASFMELLNKDYASDAELKEAINTFIDFQLSFSLDHRKNVVNNIKDVQTRYDEEEIQTTMSPYDAMSIMAQLTQIIGELKRTQSFGESYWGPRDTKRVKLLNEMIQQRRENEITTNYYLEKAGMGVVAVTGGLALVVIPRALISKGFLKSFRHFFNEASHRVLGLVQKTPGLGKLLKKGGDIEPKDIVKYSNPKAMGFRILSFGYRHLTLEGNARIHFSNTLKIRHHLSNMLYSIEKKQPSRWKSKKARETPDEIKYISEAAGSLKKGLDNLAFNPRFAAVDPTPEDQALLYFNVHRVSSDQLFARQEYQNLYQDAIDEIDLSKSQRAEFKRQYSNLFNEHSNISEELKDLAAVTEKDYLLAQKSLIKGSSRKKYGEYGEELDYTWDPSNILLTDVVYTDTMLNRLISLRDKAGAVDADFINKALDLVYKSQKYDVLNISGMKLILKKNQGKVEKVFVSRPMSYKESTTYELSTVKINSDIQPLKESDMGQEEFLEFMGQTVKSIREGNVLTRVLNLGKNGLTPVGYVSLSKTVGEDLIAKGLKKQYKDVFNFSKNKKTNFKGFLARMTTDRVKNLGKRVSNFRNNKDIEIATETGEIWIKQLAGKPENVEKIISITKNSVDSDINGFIKAVDGLTDDSIEKSLGLSAKLSDASYSIKVYNYKKAIQNVNEFPIATSLKHDLERAIDNGKIEPNLTAIKSYLKKQGPGHIKAQNENMDKVVGPLLRNEAFLAKMVKYLAGDPSSAKENFRLALKGQRVSGKTQESAEKQILIDLYHSINDALKDHINDIYKVVGEKNRSSYNNLFDEESIHWTASYYDRNLKGITQWTDKKVFNGMIVLGAALGAVGIAEMAQQNIPLTEVDYNSGMFIDESVNAVNWQSLTESTEYNDFEEAATGQRTRY
ncbi:MAG: hypothetical protein MK008_07840 [Bdellovibrionales bacterium]|nr:hypothetical protein [Bdellovibrionales bacterium]